MRDLPISHLARRTINGQPVVNAPYPKQADVLYEIFRPPYTGKVRRINLCCGWGFGKTTVAIDAAQALLDLCPNNNGLFTEPDVSLMNNFLDMWENMIPAACYEIHRGDRVIVWKRTRSKLYYDHRNMKGSLAMTIRHFQGRNYAWHIDDETSTECNLRLLNAIEARIRQPGAPILVRLTTTTPRVGEYAELLALPDSVTITGRSEDNPYITREKLDQLRATMSRAQARRDLDGELVALEDQLWADVDLLRSWPLGNVDDNHPRFNPSFPWYLFCDIGSATGAYMVVQPIPNGVAIGEPRWVIVSDLCPQSSGDVKSAFRKLRQEFGTPAGVVSGVGMGTRADTDGATPAFFVAKTWGNGVDLYIADEDHASKHIQYEVAQSLFYASDGTRRLTVARDMVDKKAQLDKDSRRGIVEMIQQDVWPSDQTISSKMYLPKGPKIRVSHIRDALLMGAVEVMLPPQWQQARHDLGGAR